MSAPARPGLQALAARVGRWRNLWLCILLVLAALLAAWAFVPLASSTDEQQGSIVISDARLIRTEHLWQLQAGADIVLPVAVRAGLDSGVPLEFLVELDVRQPRSFWFDRPIQSVRQRYRLNYFELTRHYRLQSLESGESRHFRSLLAALEGLGQLQLTEVIESPPLANTTANTAANTTARLRVRLDGQALPLPLQPLVASSWRLASEPYEWKITL